MFHLDGLSKWCFLAHAYYTVFELACSHYLLDMLHNIFVCVSSSHLLLTPPTKLGKFPSYLNVDLPWMKKGGHLLTQKRMMMSFLLWKEEEEYVANCKESLTGRISHMY